MSQQMLNENTCAQYLIQAEKVVNAEQDMMGKFFGEDAVKIMV